MADDAASGDAAAPSPPPDPLHQEPEPSHAEREPYDVTTPLAELAEEIPESRQEPEPESEPEPEPRRLGGDRGGPEWWRSRRSTWLWFGSVGLCLMIALDVYFMRRAADGGPGGAASGAPVTSAMPAVPAAKSVPLSPEAAPADAVRDTPVPEMANAGELDDTAQPAFDEDGEVDDDSAPNAPKKPKEPPHYGTVQEAAARSCSTASVDGLSRQIIEQSRCINPKAFVALPSRPNLVIGKHVFPYLEQSARDRLVRVLDSRKKDTMTINSALRTVAQQYLVWRWSASKRCGVQLATPPGESNHETGLALDIAEQAQWRAHLEAHEFHWLGAIDRVHFDYKGSTATPASTRATDVLAFQQLWNKNHPSDAIAESGRYNPETEARLKKSPPDGFAIGLACKGRRSTPTNTPAKPSKR
ncbi:MAG: M15 family metallopeptidase [Polyangiaceae bacterium]